MSELKPYHVSHQEVTADDNAGCIFMLLLVFSAGVLLGRKGPKQLSLAGLAGWSWWPSDDGLEPNEHGRLAFFRFTQLVLDLLPVLLRKYFQQRWRETHNGVSWGNTPADGFAFWYGVYETAPCCSVAVEAGSTKAIITRPEGAAASLGVTPGSQILLEGISVPFKIVSLRGSSLHLNHVLERTATLRCYRQVTPGERCCDSRMARYFQPRVLEGDVRGWDLSLLCFALLYSSHGLMDDVGHRAKALVSSLRDLRNDKLAHVERCSIDNNELCAAVRKMDDFVGQCMPSELVSWIELSRDILEGEPVPVVEENECYSTTDRDGGDEGFQDRRGEEEDFVRINMEQEVVPLMHQVGGDTGGQSEFSELIDRMANPHFITDAQQRWLGEYAVMALTQPQQMAWRTAEQFSCSTVRFA